MKHGNAKNIYFRGIRVAALFLMLGCSEREITVERSVRIIGETATVHAPTDDEAVLATAAQTVRMFNDRLYPLINIYSPQSEISRANQIASRSRFPISRDTQRILEHAQQLSVDLGGAFDVSDAAVRHLWIRHFDSEPDELLPDPLIHASRRGVGPHQYNVGDHSLLLLHPDTQLDLNAFGRPYIMDQAIAHLRRQGVGNVLIEMDGFGRALGRPSARETWTYSIPHPDNADDAFIGRVIIPDGSAYAVFGLAHHYTDVGGRPVARIIDPRSGKPADGSSLVLVLGPTATEAYTLAQALFVMDREEQTALVRRKNDYQVMIVWRDDPPRIEITRDFAPLFRPADAYRDAVRVMDAGPAQ